MITIEAEESRTGEGRNEGGVQSREAGQGKVWREGVLLKEACPISSVMYFYSSAYH